MVADSPFSQTSEPESQNKRLVEVEEFLEVTMGKHHHSVSPCFMTGKGCVYSERFEEQRRARLRTMVPRANEPRATDPEKTFQGECTGFVIMPLGGNLDVVLETCVKPYIGEISRFFDSNQLTFNRADESGRLGVIICEGICKRIQESDFITADITLPNANVFYELGLAYGIKQKIFVVCQKSPYGHQNSFTDLAVKKLGQGGCRVYEYANLEGFHQQNIKPADLFWVDTDDQSQRFDQNAAMNSILFFEAMEHGEEEKPTSALSPAGTTTHTLTELPGSKDIELLFREHAISHIKNAIKILPRKLKGRILDIYIKGIIEKQLSNITECNIETEFGELKRKIDNAYCVVMRTGGVCHALTYFWLGYAHAKGKNVIPITTKTMKGSNDKEIDDLAFDIRAQRHMVFDKEHPQLLKQQLTTTLDEMIISDFSEWSRKKFWSKLLGNRGNVSIFTGALLSTDHSREMIADWDLRAASELTSYFSRHQYKPKIEIPIYEYQPDKFPDVSAYIDQLIKYFRVGNKTAIIIGSPDVNPLTEIVFGRLYGANMEDLFTSQVGYPAGDAVVVVKQRGPERQPENLQTAKTKTPRFFCRDKEGGQNEQRGFYCRLIKDKDDDSFFLQDYYGPKEDKIEEFPVYAHLVVAKNPFPPYEGFLVVLNGAAGPATVALTHVLTGIGNEEDQSEEEQFRDEGTDRTKESRTKDKEGDITINSDPVAVSEKILNLLIGNMQDPDFFALQCFLRVTVDVKSKGAATFDRRRAVQWDLTDEVIKPKVRKFVDQFTTEEAITKAGWQKLDTPHST